ncbi:hypothetical protein [Prevotella amnii]|jgi:hypothetical protein|uniref:hypothetical protein n=1 Tax=Prevotella amnii TaxID=419005 RepID=UPI00030FC057|nr:hypothetical protein [Prevotella amnii]
MFKPEFLTETEQLKVMGGTHTDFHEESELTIWIGCGKYKWKNCRKYCTTSME